MRPVEQLPLSLKALLKDARLKHFPKGQIIIYEGDNSPELYVLKTGIVKIHDINKQGNEKILHLVGPGDIIPFAFFSGGNENTQWFYTALIDCDVFVLRKATVRRYMKMHGELTAYFLKWFSLEVHELLVRLSSLGKTNTKDKLVAVLKFLCVCHSTERPSGWKRVTFPVNHQLLADMVGVTRESTATSMKELQKMGIIRNPRLTILEIDFDKLVDKYHA